MDLPRTSSNSSINPPTIIYSPSDYSGSRSKTPISKKLLNVSNNEPQFAIIPSAVNYRPSRKREEELALKNLRKRIEGVRILQDNGNSSSEDGIESDSKTLPNDDIQNDNRPQLLQKILINRPVSMVLDLAEIKTAWQDSDFITDCLCWHNVYRQRHSAPPLTMSSELCNLAQTWANHLAHTNRFYYRNDKDIGQNLFCRLTYSLENDVSGQEVAAYWYCAGRQYNYNKETDVLHANVNAGHFTQMVWRNTRYFGIGKARSRSGKVLVVAHYAPTGNVTSSFQDNVFPPGPEYPTLQLPPRFFLNSESTTTDSDTTISSPASSIR